MVLVLWKMYSSIRIVQILAGGYSKSKKIVEARSPMSNHSLGMRP